MTKRDEPAPEPSAIPVAVARQVKKSVSSGPPGDRAADLSSPEDRPAGEVPRQKGARRKRTRAERVTLAEVPLAKKRAAAPEAQAMTPGKPSGEPSPQAPDKAAPEAEGRLQLSVIVPGLNEAESLPELTRRLVANIGEAMPYEIIYVDDGSSDNTWEVIGQLHRDNPNVYGIRLRKNFGKAMALSAGFQRARGDIVVMMDADLQDDPKDLPTFLGKTLSDELDVVVGWKVNRLDPLNRKVFSKIFNGTVGLLTGVKLHDMNCGFKAYRREVLRSLPIYGDLFRFIPVLANWRGFRVGEVPITHHERKHGRSRYGLERILRGFFDLLTVIFLTRYSRKPMHLFGFVGLLAGFVGAAICSYLTVLWFQGQAIGHRPLLLLGVLMIILGIQFFSLGLLGEFLAFQYQRKDVPEELPVRDVIGPTL